MLMAVALTFASIFVIPDKYFSKNRIEKISEPNKTGGRKKYFHDLDGNNIIEQIEFSYAESLYQCIEIKENNVLVDLYNLPENELFVSPELKFADNDKNGLVEIYYVSLLDSKAFLNVLEFDKNGESHLKIRKIYLDSVKYYKNSPDVSNYFMEFTDDGQVVFGLQAGFSIQPRRLFLYDIAKHRLKKDYLTSLVYTSVKVKKYGSQNYFLLNDVFASGNTISPKQRDIYAKSSNADTIKLYEEDKNNVYQYGDFASYIYLYNSRLEFVFPPVEYMGWTKLVSSEFIVSNKQICVLSIISSSKDSIDLQTLNLLNLKGEIIKRRKIYRKKLYLVGNFKADKVLFFSSSDKEFHVYNANLQLVRRIKVEKSVYIYGLKDLNDDKKPELITVEGDNLVIYDDNLQTKAYFPLEICDKKHQANEIFETFIKDNKSYLNIGIGDSSFIIRYYKSKRYYFKYPVYALLWGFWYFFIWGVFKINSWRLEQENKNLELIVESRTFELQEKNKLLVKQKKEIERQSEELTTNNKRLLELNKFKEMMTGTIIHDLKNPLNTIINLSDKKGVIQSAKSMKNLVLNILDVQKYEDNKMELFFESHLLSEIMEDVVEEVQVLLEEKNIQLIENYNKNIQLEVDKTIVLRVFVNLLTNAIKFSQLNSAIEIKAAVTSENLIMIEVIDNGMGIPENQIDLIFDKFVQADHRGLGELKSTGLGLTFCKMAIEAHCGMIKAKNRASAGAVFLFSLNGKIIPKQNPKKTPSEKADNGLSEKEMELLKPVLKKLQTIPVFEASEILLALQQIESKNLVINAWIERVKSAVFAANSQMYKHLIGKNTAS